MIEISGAKMKTKKDFAIPMSNQMLEIVKEIKKYSYHISNYVFPSPSSTKKPISDNTLNMALKRMGYKDKMTPHGFRAMFSTIAHENINVHGHHSDVIELCLAHEERNKVKSAYNRESKYKHIEERRNLIKWYCDWLDIISD